MDLTAVSGIGPAYSERLRGAGVGDVAALARAEDLARLHDATGIPLARLRAMQEEARRLAATATPAAADDEPDLGIATQGLAHELDATAARASETMRQAWLDARALVAQKWSALRQRTDGVASRVSFRRQGRHA